MTDSVFTKIIKGEIPSHKVYEDAKTLAFMDIYPIQPGMVVVIPKTQIADFYDLNDDEYQALWATVKKVATKMKEVFPNKRKIGIQVEGLDVEHVHVKMFPIDSGAEFHAKQDTSSEPNHKELAKMADKLKINN
jgi:histidine triad (HIT) family protein